MKNFEILNMNVATRCIILSMFIFLLPVLNYVARNYNVFLFLFEVFFPLEIGKIVVKKRKKTTFQVTNLKKKKSQ